MRNRRVKNYSSERHSKYRSVLQKMLKVGIFIFTLVTLITTVVLLKTPSQWKPGERLALAVPKSDGDLAIIVFDPKASTVVQMTIPKSTQITAAGGLGQWKVGSLKSLSDQEKKDGKLITESLLKTFKLPISAWGDQEALNFADKNIFKVFRSALIMYPTNLSLIDKFKLAWFSARVDQSDKFSIDLLKTNNLISTTLKDGEKGYIPKEKLSPEVLSYFVDNQIAEITPRVAIINGSGRQSTASDVADALEVLGANVVAIQVADDSESDCFVKGKNAEVTSHIASLFSCKIDENELTGNFDIEFVFGSAFSKRF